MNWQKITPETQLPKPGQLIKENKGVLVRHISSDVYSVAILVNNKARWLMLSGFQEWMKFEDFTHYCIITPPTK